MTTSPYTLTGAEFPPHPQTLSRPPVRFLLEPAGDLLRRPAVLEPPDHVLTQGGIGGELPTPLPASPRQVLGVQGEVAAEAAVAVAEAVPAQLAVDGGGVSPEPGGDLAHGAAGLDEAAEGASLGEVEVTVGPGQKAPPSTRGKTPGTSKPLIELIFSN